MKQNITFSVIIPVYNVQKYLAKCIESVLDQRYTGFEVILVDDGSLDGSGIICDDYAGKDSRVRVIHQENSGLSQARNRGMCVAKGEYVVFLDSDDYWYSENVLEDIYNRLKKTNADVLSFDYIEFEGDKVKKSYFCGNRCNPFGHKDFSLNYQVKSGVWIACAWNKAIKRELLLLNNLSFKKGITSEDIDWCIRLALAADKFDYLDKVCVCYRQRKESISNSIDAYKTMMLLDNIEYCLDLLEEAKDKEKSSALKPYIGYQFGTAIYHTSVISDKDDYKRLRDRLSEYKYLLSWSDNRKVKLLKIADSIGGMGFVMMLLRLKDKMI